MAEAPVNVILHRESGKSINFVSWVPMNVYSKEHTVKNGSYNKFENISQTVHFEDYMEMVEASSMEQQVLGPASHTHLLAKYPGIKGSWFAVDKPGKEKEHNWYGNVSFIVDLNKFLSGLEEFCIYYMENIDYQTKNVSRFLVTYEDLDLPKYDPEVEGGPWHQDPSGQNWVLKSRRRADGTLGTGYELEVELFLVLPSAEHRYLWSVSWERPANHKLANSEERCACRKYRSGHSRWVTCPSDWSLEETLEMVEFLAEPN